MEEMKREKIKFNFAELFLENVSNIYKIFFDLFF